MASVGISTAAASRNGAARLKNAFIRSQKYRPMQPCTQAITSTANIMPDFDAGHTIQYGEKHLRVELFVPEQRLAQAARRRCG